jgi:hypothetical protein
VTWGETDGLKLLDLVNATDFRHFLIDDMEDSKIPEWMLNLTYYFNQDYNLQFLWIPQYVQNFQAPAGSAWALDGVNLIYYFDHFDALNIVNSGGRLLRLVMPAIITTIIRTIRMNSGSGLRGTSEAARTSPNYFYTHQKTMCSLETTSTRE